MRGVSGTQETLPPGWPSNWWCKSGLSGVPWAEKMLRTTPLETPPWKPPLQTSVLFLSFLSLKFLTYWWCVPCLRIPGSWQSPWHLADHEQMNRGQSSKFRRDTMTVLKLGHTSRVSRNQKMLILEKNQQEGMSAAIKHVKDFMVDKGFYFKQTSGWKFWIWTGSMLGLLLFVYHSHLLGHNFQIFLSLLSSPLPHHSLSSAPPPDLLGWLLFPARGLLPG